MNDERTAGGTGSSSEEEAWERARTMTDEEIEKTAMKDLDALLTTEEDWEDAVLVHPDGRKRRMRQLARQQASRSGRPRKKKVVTRSNKVRVHTLLPADLYEFLDAEASVRDITLTAVLEDIVREAKETRDG
jgi:hypothetical protein